MSSFRWIFMALLLFSTLLSACSPQEPMSETPRLEHSVTAFFEELDAENMFTSIEELTKEPRLTGTESEKQAASFLADQLESYGYTVNVQSFEFEKYRAPTSLRLMVDGFNGTLSPAAFQFSVSGQVTGEIVEAGFGLESDYNDIDVAGKIAIVAAERTSFHELVRNAGHAGAAAIIIYFPKGYPINRWSLGKHDNAFIPALALSYNEGRAVLDHMKTDVPIKGTVTIEGSRIDKAESQNLIALKQPDFKTAKSKEIITIGAHYDSVQQAPGASDNASGTAVVLELARALRDVPTHKEIRFLFFGAEEVGLLGSEYYVSTLSKKDSKHSVAMFNLDMVGSSDAGKLAIQTVDGTANTVTKAASKAYEELHGHSVSIDTGARSDHTPFQKAGIDAALFIYYPLEEWYHSPDDTIDKISKEKLLNVAKIVGKSALELTASHNTDY
ncbi:M20/M25/M40 family metallo-hydrolase [Sporosarcina sp. ACRSM]|uniref:M28 family metallopeptidase n=1 Tax=Sporosarcina sp. ACRSM TaxID=2918216 RepID=UPI001EF3E88E|nr:M20/M25/M40 family metallo-hydrolase [Sporosarcina sp. ACRSM]